MAKIMWLNVPANGHINPTLPVATELVNRGHTVLYPFTVSLGRQANVEALGPIPNNFLLQPTVPQLELLPKVDLFVTHGGMNSINEALYFGVPLVVVPQQLEQALNGRQAASKGAAILLGDRPPYGQVTMTDLCAAVNAILANLSYRHAATTIGRSFQKASGYQRAADLIEQKLWGTKEGKFFEK